MIAESVHMDTGNIAGHSIGGIGAKLFGISHPNALLSGLFCATCIGYRRPAVVLLEAKNF